MIYVDGLFLAQKINGINRYSREVLKSIGGGLQRIWPADKSTCSP